MTAQRGDLDRPPAPAEPVDTDRATATEVLWGSSSDHGVMLPADARKRDRVAAALADAREQGRAEANRLRERLLDEANRWALGADALDMRAERRHRTGSQAMDYYRLRDRAAERRELVAALRAALEDR